MLPMNQPPGTPTVAPEDLIHAKEPRNKQKKQRYVGPGFNGTRYFSGYKPYQLTGTATTHVAEHTTRQEKPQVHKSRKRSTTTPPWPSAFSVHLNEHVRVVPKQLRGRIVATLLHPKGPSAPHYGTLGPFTNQNP